MRVLAAAAGLMLLALVGWALVRGGNTSERSTTTNAASPKIIARPAAARHPIRRTNELAVSRTSTLAAPLQDAAGASLAGAGVLLAGGLTSADTSTNALTVVRRAGVRSLGRLPTAFHDGAAASIGRDVYLFGGGDGVAQLDGILRIDSAGTVTTAGRLPSPSSDQAATALDGTAYIVGGYTGTRWLDTIVAFRPGRRAHVVAHLPTPVRYAAVAAVAGSIVIAGGSLPSGTASRTIYTYDPRSRAVRLVARLPQPITHAAAAAVGSTVFVIGGRGPAVGTPTDRIVAIDLPRGRVRPGGRLPAALSDLVAVRVGGHVVVAGGRGASGTVSSVSELAPRPIRRPASSSSRQALRNLNVYAADRAGDLTGAARFARALVYVPNSDSNSVDVIDPRTFRIVEHFAVGALPQHVVPSWDLKTLYVTNDAGNSLTTIDPRTGRPGRTIPVDDPYNMYFTPDGRYAIVVAERLGRLDFRAAHSFKLRHSLPLPCAGVDHLDFSADGSYLLASCEFSDQLVKVDVAGQRVVGTLQLARGGAPQDVKLSPDGRVFYVADMLAGGVWLVDGNRLRVLGFLRTGAGAHGLYPSRDARFLYVTNRSAGTISVIGFRTRRVVATWTIPGGGSPDMGNVSADGKVLWLSGRYDSEVYAVSTTTGRLLARIKVGVGPHGLCVWPQPGRYSLGHTGILR